MSGKDLDFKKPSFESHEDNPDLYLEWHNPCSSHLHSSESELDITDCSFSTASSANITSIDTPINTSLKSKASISDCRIRKVKYKTGFNVFFGNEPHTMKITGPTETNIPTKWYPIGIHVESLSQLYSLYPQYTSFHFDNEEFKSPTGNNPFVRLARKMGLTRRTADGLRRVYISAYNLNHPLGFVTLHFSLIIDDKEIQIQVHNRGKKGKEFKSIVISPQFRNVRLKLKERKENGTSWTIDQLANTFIPFTKRAWGETSLSDEEIWKEIDIVFKDVLATPFDLFRNNCRDLALPIIRKICPTKMKFISAYLEDSIIKTSRLLIAYPLSYIRDLKNFAWSCVRCGFCRSNENENSEMDDEPSCFCCHKVNPRMSESNSASSEER